MLSEIFRSDYILTIIIFGSISCLLDLNYKITFKLGLILKKKRLKKNFLGEKLVNFVGAACAEIEFFFCFSTLVDKSVLTFVEIFAIIFLKISNANSALFPVKNLVFCHK